MAKVFLPKTRIESQMPIRAALIQVLKTFGTEIVEDLEDTDEKEADVVVIYGSAEEALRIMNETETAQILIICDESDQWQACEAFARRNNERVSAAWITSAVVTMLQIVAQKG